MSHGLTLTADADSEPMVTGASRVTAVSYQRHENWRKR